MKGLYNHIFFKTVLIITVFLLPFRNIEAQTITVTGNWNNIPLSPITEAGTDYVNSIESATNQILIDAHIPLFVYDANILVKYIKTNWPNELGLYIKRTGYGTPQALCIDIVPNGGTNYMKIGVNNKSFFYLDRTFSGCTYHYDIPIQLKLSGLSVTLPVDNYSCRVVFTVTAL